jgi:hypothetical protein
MVAYTVEIAQRRIAMSLAFADSCIDRLASQYGLGGTARIDELENEMKLADGSVPFIDVRGFGRVLGPTSAEGDQKSSCRRHLPNGTFVRESNTRPCEGGGYEDKETSAHFGRGHS